MTLFDAAALVLGAGLIFSGVRAIRRQRVCVPEERVGGSAVRLGWLWIGLGALFLAAVVFDVSALKTLFRLFLQAEN